MTHVTAEEASEDPSVLFGTLRLNSNPVTVLFDSGALHSFMSLEFARKNRISFTELSTPLRVQSPGSSWLTALVKPELLLNVGSLSFPTILFALKSTDIDIILGMNWLVKYQVVIDWTTRWPV